MNCATTNAFFVNERRSIRNGIIPVSVWWWKVFVVLRAIDIQYSSNKFAGKVGRRDSEIAPTRRYIYSEIQKYMHTPW